MKKKIMNAVIKDDIKCSAGTVNAALTIKDPIVEVAIVLVGRT